MMDQPAPKTVAICDPVTLEIVKGALRAAQSEMEALIERTAMSAFIREKKDFYAALFDADGRMVVGSNVPIFGDILQPVFDRYPRAEMRPGDIYWYNDCYESRGAVSHTPDQVFIAPVFVDGVLCAFAQSWAHFNDVGGMRPGSLSPDCTDIFQEGIIVPPIRVARDGAFNEEALRIFYRNSRFPAMVQGDTRASVAAVRLGEKRLVELIQRFGREVVADAFRRLIAQTEAAVTARLRAAFPPGTYRFTDTIDRDGQGNGPFKVRLKMVVTADRVVLDTSESDDQAPGPINFLMHPTVPKAILGFYFLGADPTLVFNAGVEGAVDEVVLRPGSLLQPNFPAPLGQRGLTMIRTMTACMGLINEATGGKGVASSSAYVIYYLRGDAAGGHPFLLTDGVGVGYGARPTADGIDGVYFVAQENYPAEFLDLSYPVRLRAYGVNMDSGGPGRWRGGCGVIREIELLAPEAVLSMRIDSVDHPPWGVAGGRNGGTGRAIVNPGRPDERILEPLSDGTVMRRGDVLRLETGGGGGWGHPFEREAERVLKDVLGGFVSRDSAERDYGVVLTADGRAVDEAATARCRGNAPRQAKLFHRRVYVDALE
ncbi:MAG: hydantoinase B/oxoprolinase family protein [Proteobacteria bacterium]|nr:hydantoinase B/oxoprolinase family protein [Pseudomonadota bacterium]